MESKVPTYQVRRRVGAVGPSSPPAVETCGDCRFWRPPVGQAPASSGFQPSGWCRRYPEAVGKNPGDWCGEYQGKAKPS